MLKFMRRTFSNLVSVVLALAIGLAPVGQAFAQAGDTEAPVLIHRQLDSGVAGELQTFLARVSDDFGVENVTLYYRQSDRGDFRRIEMRPLLDSIGEYMIAVETSVSAYPGLQYYIEALDVAGNSTNRGFSYAPIVLPLEAPVITQADTATTGPIVEPRIPEQPVADGDGAGFSTSRILLGLAAVLAVGALASGGGSDDSPTNTSTPTPNPPSGPNTVTLTIVSEVPASN